MTYFFAIIAIVVVVNIYLLFKNSKRKRNVGKESTKQRIETEKHHEELVRKLGYEQEDALRRVELRNKTLEMYEQVRRQAEEQEQEAEIIDND